MGWVEVKLKAVVWLPEEKDPWTDGEDDFDTVNKRLKDNFPLFEEMPGECFMTDTPESTPPKCPDCDAQIESWDDVKVFNVGDDGRPDWYFLCRKCAIDIQT